MPMIYEILKISRGLRPRTPANALCTASPAPAAHFNSLGKKSMALDTRRLVLVPTIAWNRSQIEAPEYSPNADNNEVISSVTK